MYRKTYGNNFLNLKTRNHQGQPDVDVEQSEAIMPKSVSPFVYYLLTGSKDDAHSSKRAQRLVSSFGQDMIYAITYGKTKPPKYTILPFAIKSLTGNVELIYTLDRLGPTPLSKRLTQPSVCKKLLLSEGDVPLPANIHPGVLISGEGTSHRVNGIAVQTMLVNPQPSKVLPSVGKTKKNIISTPPLMLPTYNVGQ